MMPIMKLIGAIPVEGAKSIFKVVKRLKENDGTKIVICPEGQLAKTDEWNSGFFYMSKVTPDIDLEELYKEDDEIF